MYWKGSVNHPEVNYIRTRCKVRASHIDEFIGSTTDFGEAFQLFKEKPIPSSSIPLFQHFNIIKPRTIQSPFLPRIQTLSSKSRLTTPSRNAYRSFRTRTRRSTASWLTDHQWHQQPDRCDQWEAQRSRYWWHPGTQCLHEWHSGALRCPSVQFRPMPFRAPGDHGHSFETCDGP